MVLAVRGSKGGGKGLGLSGYTASEAIFCLEFVFAMFSLIVVLTTNPYALHHHSVSPLFFTLT